MRLVRLALAADDTAVDRKVLTGDPASVRPNQKGDRIRDILRLAQSTQRGHIDERREYVVFAIAHGFLHHVSFDEPGRNCVDRYATWRNFFGEHPAILFDGRLAAEVARTTGQIELGSDGRYANDPSAIRHMA